MFCLFRATPAAYGSSRLGVESELQLPAYTTVAAMRDPSHICDLHHNSPAASCSCQPTPQSQQCKIRAISVTYTTTHSAVSLTH